MTSRCGGRSALARSASRCSTPNRCCSSTTTSPRSKNSTRSCSSAWVPMTMPASPEAASSRAWRRAAVGWLPVSRRTWVPCAWPPSIPPSARSPSIWVIERWCCWARTSVGASRAACPPESTTVSIARSATTVLPEPTSPCSSRCIGCACSRSSSMARLTATWPSVRANGSRASNASRTPARPDPARHRRLGGDLGPTAGQRDLEEERLLEAHALLGARRCPLARWGGAAPSAPRRAASARAGSAPARGSGSGSSMQLGAAEHGADGRSMVQVVSLAAAG